MEEAKIRWQCRRGMLELDMILLSFFDAAYRGLTPPEKEAFVCLLTSADHTLYGWLIKREPCLEPSFIPILEKIKQLSWAKSNSA